MIKTCEDISCVHNFGGECNSIIGCEKLLQKMNEDVGSVDYLNSWLESIGNEEQDKTFDF